MKIEKRIKRIIKKSDNIFVTGHKNLDLDAIGACIGIYAIAKKYKKECYIINDDTENELGVTKIIDETSTDYNFIKSEKIPNLYKKHSILIVVDTNKANLIQNDKILHYFNNIIVIDHHQETEQTINGINVINDNISSACEMVTFLIREYGVEITEEEATILLSGIVLDTSNFTKKASADTFYEAYSLVAYGANPKKVQYYLKEELKDYIIRNKVIVNTEIINDNLALAVAENSDLYKKEELAKIANTLMNFNDIDASFVIGKRQDGGVGISARSEGNINVGIITEKLGGGGDICNAACHITDMSLSETESELKKVLNEEE